MNALFRKLRWFAQRDRRDAEVREELEFHLAEEAEDRKANGLPDEQARSEARRELGNVTLIAEDVRAAWTWPGVERIVQDLRFGLRGLRRSPGFTLVSVLTLGLAIGTATAMYGVVDGVVLRPLPYPRAEQIVALKQVYRSGQSGTVLGPELRRSAGGKYQLRGDGRVQPVGRVERRWLIARPNQASRRCHTASSTSFRRSPRAGVDLRPRSFAKAGRESPSSAIDSGTSISAAWPSCHPPDFA